MDFLFLLVPDHVKLRNLFLHLAKLRHRLGCIHLLRQHQPVGHDRLQHRKLGILLFAQPHAGPGGGKSQNGAHRSRLRGCHGAELLPGIDPDAAHLLPVDLVADGKISPGKLHKSHPLPVAVPLDFIYLCGEGLPVGRGNHVFLQTLQKLRHSRILQGRPEEAGHQIPPENGCSQPLRIHRTCLQEFLQLRLPAGGGILKEFLRVILREVHKASAQNPLHLIDEVRPAAVGQVHLIHKYKHRNPVTRKQTPQSLCVRLHSLGTAYQKNRVIQHLERTLHLRGKIHVARRVQKGHLPVSQGENGLLGENRDSPGLLQSVGIQEGISPVNPSQAPDDAAVVEHRLRQRRLSGVYVCQDSCRHFCHSRYPLCLQ